MADDIEQARARERLLFLPARKCGRTAAADYITANSKATPLTAEELRAMFRRALGLPPETPTQG